MQPSTGINMNVDDSRPRSRRTSSLAAPEAMIPHNDIESRQLAVQASHLTLAVPYNRADASSVPSGTHGGVPTPSGSRSRTCSACSSSASDAPLLAQHRHASTSSSVLDARHAPPSISHEYAREEPRMRAAAGDVQFRHCMQQADNLPLVLVRNDPSLADLPNEVLLHILGCLDVCDLLLLSRTSHQFRSLALAPILHRHRLRHVRCALPPLLTSPSRPSLADLIARRVFLTNTTVVSRKLARSLTAIRLSRRLAVRPPPETLVARAVLPREYVHGRVAPALVANTRAVERERVKDGLRRWVGSVWERRWREVVEERRVRDQRGGVGRVWRLRRFWEGVGRGDVEAR